MSGGMKGSHITRTRLPQAATFKTSATTIFRPGDTTGDVSGTGDALHAGDTPVMLEDAQDGDTSDWTAYGEIPRHFLLPDSGYVRV